MQNRGLLFSVVSIAVCMCSTGVSVISAIVASIIQNQPAAKKPPDWCRSLLAGHLANLLCTGRNNKTASIHPGADSKDAAAARNVDDEGTLARKDLVDTAQPEATTHLQQIVDKKKSKEEGEDHAAEWRRLSAFVDRCIFVICALLSISYNIFVVATLRTAPDNVDTSGPAYIVK